VLVRPVEEGLTMQQLLYADEVRSWKDIPMPDKPQLRDAEVKLAHQLVDQIASETFDPSQYEDEVKKRIEAAIEKKLEGQEIAVSPSVPEATGQVIDLMEALKASLAKASTKRASAKTQAADEGAAEAKTPARKATKSASEEPAPRRKVKRA